MEATFRTISTATALKERLQRTKRKRDETPGGSSGALSDTTEPLETPTEPAEPDGNVFDEGVQRRMVHTLTDWSLERHGHLYKGGSNAHAFVSRTAVGAWLALQAAKPMPVGIFWPALLFVCWVCADGAFRDGVEVSTIVDGWNLSASSMDLNMILRRLGHNSHALTAQDASHQAEYDFMTCARQWARQSEAQLQAAVQGAVRHVADDEKARLVMRGVLWNTRRAQQLFVHTE